MSLRDHPRAVRRMDAEPRNALFLRRWYKAMERFGRKERSETQDPGWVPYRKAGLIHNGRKP